ncbi:MAG: caspase family protein [Candidatus Thermoplasmatota archaeon]
MYTKKKVLALITTILFLISSLNIVSLSTGKSTNNQGLKDIIKNITQKENEEEHWALIIGINEYKNSYDPENTTIAGEYDALNMYEALTSNGFCPPDHVKLLTGKNATKINIIKGLIWLDRHEDHNDISLIHISTHGGRKIDLPPFDEEDFLDETLTTYKSFEPSILSIFTLIRDDLLNYFISRLESKGICLIIDSCYSGGYNDQPVSPILWRSQIFNNIRRKIESFTGGLFREIENNRRVLLASTTEDTVSWSDVTTGGLFSTALTESLGKGFGDFNNDGMISAEEAFKYAQTCIKTKGKYSQTPVIYDNYTGELNITKAKYRMDFFENCEDNIKNWTTIDHSNQKTGNLWHISEKDYLSLSHSWLLQNETLGTYYNSMNNSIVSPIIETHSDNITVLFNYKTMSEKSDKLYFGISSSNSSSVFVETKLNHSKNWSRCKINLENLSDTGLNNSIKIRFRFKSDDKNPYNVKNETGYISIDDIQVYSYI